MRHAATIDQNVNPDVRDRSLGERTWTNNGMPGPRERTRRTKCRVGVTNRRNLAAAEPYEAKRRCTATGYCNARSRRSRRGQQGSRSGSAAPDAAGFQLHMSPVVARPEPGTKDDDMDTEEPCTTRSKRAKTIMGREMCVQEPMDEVFDLTFGGRSPSPSVNPDKSFGDDDDVPPEVTHELNRLKALGKPYEAPGATDRIPKRDVQGTRSSELLDRRPEEEGGAKDLTTRSGQEALSVIPRSALQRGTKIARDKFVEAMKSELVNSRFMAAEVARDVRYDVYAGTPALKALRMIFSIAAMRDGKRRPRCVALYVIMAAFVHTTIDAVVAVLALDGLLERDECFLLLQTHKGTRGVSKPWQQH